MTDDTPFFIVGAGRSGTTLLRLILTGHSRLHIPAETWFLRPLLREFPLTDPMTQAQVAQAVTTMLRHERWADIGMAPDELRRQADLLAQPKLVQLIDIVYRHLRAASGKPRLGDKTPHYFSIVPELATLYPAAKFIHLLRDGRDVAMSWIDAGWQRYYEPGFEWQAAVTALQRDRQALPGRLLAVRYEDLVRQPETVIRRICAFLDEAFEPGMLAFHDRIGMVAPRDRHLHARLRTPLSEDAIALWRKRLSAAECFAMEACLHRALLQAGYSLRFAAPAWRPMFRLSAAASRALAPLLHRGVPYLQRHGWLPGRSYF